MLQGREIILTDEEMITEGNVLSVIRDAYNKHRLNLTQIDELYEYNKGRQPILDRVKDIRGEINHRIVENRANAITSFKVGYMVGKPIQYVSMVSDNIVSEKVAKLNDLMRVAGKPTKDRELVEWQMICGTGYRLVMPNPDPKTSARRPFFIYTLDPRETFCIYRNDYTREKLAGVTYKTDKNGKVTFSVYTKEYIYTIKNTANPSLVDIDKNTVWAIPIIEYPANTQRIGAIEAVKSLLDAVNLLDSDRMNAVSQFIQSLTVFTNCEPPSEEDGGMAAIREHGAICLTSTAEGHQSVEILSQELSQTDNETLKSSFIQAINDIVGLPNPTSQSSGDNNGAVILKNGWSSAETRAEEFEAMFKEPEREFLRVVSVICNALTDISFYEDELDIKFTRNSYENLLSKAQTLTTLLQNPLVHPRCAYEVSTLFVDTEEAYRMGIEWRDENAAKAKAETEKEESTETEENDVEDIPTGGQENR